jgi:hypothetical protein
MYGQYMSRPTAFNFYYLMKLSITSSSGGFLILLEFLLVSLLFLLGNEGQIITQNASVP